MKTPCRRHTNPKPLSLYERRKYQRSNQFPPLELPPSTPERLAEVCNSESASDGRLHFLIICKEILDGVVARYIELLKVERDSWSLDLTGALPFICPYLEIVSETYTSLVKIINEDWFLTLITVPPLVLGLNVEVRLLCSDLVALAHTWRSPIPYTSDFFLVLGRYLQLVCCLGLNKLW